DPVYSGQVAIVLNLASDRLENIEARAWVEYRADEIFRLRWPTATTEQRISFVRAFYATDSILGTVLPFARGDETFLLRGLIIWALPTDRLPKAAAPPPGASDLLPKDFIHCFNLETEPFERRSALLFKLAVILGGLACDEAIGKWETHIGGLVA